MDLKSALWEGSTAAASVNLVKACDREECTTHVLLNGNVAKLLSKHMGLHPEIVLLEALAEKLPFFVFVFAESNG